MFLSGLTSQVYINLIGRLMLSELLAVFFFPLFNLSTLLKSYPTLRKVLKGLMFLLLVQILSDVYNETELSNALRGCFVIVFSMISVVFFVKCFGNEKSVITYLFSLFVIQLLFGKVNLDVSVLEENSNFFKTRFVGFINMFLMIVSYYLYKKRLKRIVPLIFIIYSIICLVLDARSNGLIFFISTLFLVIKNRRIKFNGMKYIVLFIISSVVFYLSYISYVNKVLSNSIGGSNASIQMNAMNNPYNPFELLYMGRKEAFIAFQAILDKPVMGHGSWAEDKEGRYSNMINSIAGRNHVVESEYIPNHSVLLGAWLFSGILGFFAIVYIFSSLFKVYFKIFKRYYEYPVFPIITFTTANMMWAVMFSPFGLLRTTFPLFASLLIVYNEKYKLSKEYE